MEDVYILAVVATAVLTVGGTIAGLARKFICKDDVNNGFKRVDNEIKDVRKELSEKVDKKEIALITSRLEGKIDRLDKDIKDMSADTKELLKGFAKIEAVMDERRRL